MFEGTEHVCVWGYEDFDRIADGNPQTWIHPKCHPDEIEIAYERATGEIHMRCRACDRTQRRFAVAA